ILMVVGGDIIQQALAQLSGSHGFPFTPVAFSFGWVSYTFSAILSATGNGRLMPQPDTSAILINVDSGYSRDVKSWILSRLLRDCESEITDESGLTIKFFYTSPSKAAGLPDRDWVYYSGIVVILAQLGIAAIPGALGGDWMPLAIIAAGTILALLSGALPQWGREKWAARDVGEGKRDVICLTRGNGSKLALVIISEGCGLRLEDLASARVRPSRGTILAFSILSTLWLALLVVIQCFTSSAWITLVAVGALGTVQNIIAASARRTHAALGFHFNEAKTKVVHKVKVFGAIKEAEAHEGKVGLVLTGVFFPHGLRPDEEEWRQ
ncbi:hypothetical protein BOTBODRAFT_79354, partial [Botryobasidium botryosum FD-172 SS1]